MLKYRSMYFTEGKLRLIDQSALPTSVKHIELSSHYAILEAMNTGKLNGCITVSLAAAYAMAIAASSLIRMNGENPKNWDEALSEFERVGRDLKIVDHAIPGGDKMIKHARDVSRDVMYDPGFFKTCMERRADCLMREAITSSGLLGRIGNSLIEDKSNVLVHGNCGALAAPEAGTALAPVYEARREGKSINVFVCETRPKLLGSRLTAWELAECGTLPCLLCDSAAATLMKQGRISIVLAGASRIYTNGDVVGDPGLYGLAVMAKAHNVPFYIAAPLSTIRSNAALPVDEGNPCELKVSGGKPVAPTSAVVFNPSYDIVPASLLSGIVTDHSVITPVGSEAVRSALVL